MISTQDVDYGLSLLRERQARDRKFSTYYDGKYDLSFASHNFRQAFGSWLRNVGYNRCRSVVDAFSDRTVITGWDIPNGSQESVGRAQDIWLRNGMDTRQNELWKETYRSGDGYVVVWPDEATGEARIFVNRAHCLTVVYDAEYPDHVDYAVKCWQVERGADKGKWRLTVYDPEMVARYVTSKTTDTFPRKVTQFVPYEADGQPEVANPLGEVPVVHFGNDADTGGYGTSELADVVPLQDGANKTIADLLIAEEFGAYPQRYAIGIDEDDDDPNTGQPVRRFLPGQGRMWVTPGSEQGEQPVQFGQFEATDMGQFVEVRKNWDEMIANVSRVPVSWLNPAASGVSGETKKMDEAPFVSKVTDRQKSHTSPAARMMRLCLRVENVGDEQASPVKPIWMPAESRSEREKYEIAAMMRTIDVPVEMVWAKAGFDAAEIEEMRKLRDAAAERQQKAFASAFDGGDDRQTT